MTRALRLRTLGLLLVALAFFAGLSSAWLWLSSVRNWDDHLARAYLAGFALDASLRHGNPPPPGVVVTTLGDDEAGLVARGEYLQLRDAPKPAYVTNMSLIQTGRDPLLGEALALVIISGKLRYPVGEIASDEGQTAAQKLGGVTRLLAAYCSEPVLYARVAQGVWRRVDGAGVWGCAAAPRDLRLAAALAAAVALAVLATLLANTAAHFERFARALRDRGRLGGPEIYSTEGPAELGEIVAAVNTHLERERAQLGKRAIVLSGVSHDLGTPATRLRLRAALIGEPELRARFEADIDSMTGMIESVLTYTRAELNAEEPRTISLLSLVQALVDDYRDTGRPVSFQHGAPQVVEGGRSLFSATPGHGVLRGEQRVLVVARPMSLQRAVSNLIDNALKYGRRASVELEASASRAVITVEDEGSDVSAADIEAVLAPFRRGENTGSIGGFGLGLTIVATVAEQHGGKLDFENGPNGLRARLEISRN